MAGKQNVEQESGQLLPRCRDDLIINDLGPEVLVYDPRVRGAHRLTGILAVVFRCSLEGATMATAVATLGAGSRLEEERAESLIGRALSALAALDLLEPVGFSRTSSWSPNRRSFLEASGKLGLTASLVTSVFAPTPAAAVSLGGGFPGVLSSSPGPSRESYDFREDNPFRWVDHHPVSTFAADVDTASYSNVRRFLRSGQLPPADAVRVEEMINYFPSPDHSPVSEGEVLALDAELGRCPWQPGHSLLKLELRSTPIETSDLPVRNLVFLLDVSGSMNSPDKLPLVRAAMELLVETLGAEDRVAIVVYAGAAGLVLEPTPGADRARILAALDRLQAGGSTNGGAGIGLAYAVARRMMTVGSSNRVILATDGDFNVGVSSRGELLRLIEREKQSGVFLSILGFGTGNLNDSTIEQIANRGNGNYSYIDSLSEARRVLVEAGGATLHTVARDVKLQVEWNPSQIERYRLIGYENRLLARQDFEDDAKDGGEIGAGHRVTVLYELVEHRGDDALAAPPGKGLRYQRSALSRTALSDEVGVLRLRFQQPTSSRTREEQFPLTRRAIEVSSVGRSSAFRLAAGVAMFGMLLRDSPYLGDASYEMAGALVASGIEDDPGGYREELLELISEASELSSRRGIAS